MGKFRVTSSCLLFKVPFGGVKMPSDMEIHFFSLINLIRKSLLYTYIYICSYTNQYSSYITGFDCHCLISAEFHGNKYKLL